MRERNEEREREKGAPRSRVQVLLLIFCQATEFDREREVHSDTLVFVSLIHLVLAELHTHKIYE